MWLHPWCGCVADGVMLYDNYCRGTPVGGGMAPGVDH